MREPVRDRERLEHMLEAIDRILNYTNGKTKAELEDDKMKFYGLVKNIEIIGEAVYKLSIIFRKEHPNTPWNDIMKMRHVLVHDYFQIDEDSVIYVIEDDLPPLRRQIVKYLNEVNWDEWEKNEVVIVETATHKSLVLTATRMKARGYNIDEISKITGLSREEIEGL